MLISIDHGNKQTNQNLPQNLCVRSARKRHKAAFRTKCAVL